MRSIKQKRCTHDLEAACLWNCSRQSGRNCKVKSISQQVHRKTSGPHPPASDGVTGESCTNQIGDSQGKHFLPCLDTKSMCDLWAGTSHESHHHVLCIAVSGLFSILSSGSGSVRIAGGSLDLSFHETSSQEKQRPFTAVRCKSGDSSCGPFRCPLAVATEPSNVVLRPATARRHSV